jgi:hypothetical protein
LRSFIIFLGAKYYYGSHIGEGEFSNSFEKYAVEEKGTQNYIGQSLGRRPLGTPSSGFQGNINVRK